ncbi:hypothetical protein ACT7C5_29250 [Bacillus pacificus]
MECQVKLFTKGRGDVVSEGIVISLVRIQYDNYRLNIRVFHKEILEEMGLVYTIIVTKGKSGVYRLAMSLERIMHHDFDETPHMAIGGLIRMGEK